MENEAIHLTISNFTRISRIFLVCSVKYNLFIGKKLLLRIPIISSLYSTYAKAGNPNFYQRKYVSGMFKEYVKGEGQLTK